MTRRWVLVGTARGPRGYPGDSPQATQAEIRRQITGENIPAQIGQQLDERDLPGQIVQAIANDGTVADAAAAAAGGKVDDYLATKPVVLRTDRGAPNETPGVFDDRYAIWYPTDDGYTTGGLLIEGNRWHWVRALIDDLQATGPISTPGSISAGGALIGGGLTVEVDPHGGIRFVTADGRLTELDIAPDGQFQSWVTRRIGAREGWGQVTPTRVFTPGNSMMAALGGYSEMGILLAQKLGLQWIAGGGRVGITAQQIAAFQTRAISTTWSFPGRSTGTVIPPNTIPAGAPVAVPITLRTPAAGILHNPGASFDFPGSFVGKVGGVRTVVAGKITVAGAVLGAPGYWFTPTAALPEAVSILPPVPFYSSGGLAVHGAVMPTTVARNNINDQVGWSAENVTGALDAQAAIVDQEIRDGNVPVVLPCYPRAYPSAEWITDGDGNPNPNAQGVAIRQAIDSYNAQAAVRFAAYWCDTLTPLIERGPESRGAVPTANDLVARGRRQLSPSDMVPGDELHLGAGKETEAEAIAEYCRAMQTVF